MRDDREPWLDAALSALARARPPDVDVTARVMRGIRRQSPVRRHPWVPHLVGAAAAVAGALALAWLGPPPALLSDTAGPLYRLARHGVAGTLALGSTLLSLFLKLLAGLVDSMAPLLPLLAELRPLALGGIAVGSMIMAGTILYFVGRDLRGSAPAHEERYR